MRNLLACGVVLTAACAQQPKTAVTDDFVGLDAKSDSFSYRMTIVGSLDYGQTSSSTRYTRTPRYRAFKFAGNEGDQVDVWVRSQDGGDAVAWVLDNGFHVLASNDDADDTTLDAHVSVTLPANASATHYIVFRDYWTSTADFSVELASSAPACQIDADCATFSNGDASMVPQCNFGSHHCQMIRPEDIHCGGFIANVHACPAGYMCQLETSHPDVGGSCVPAQP
jgi:hypothetical protein